MLVSIEWLKELMDLNNSIPEVIQRLNLTTIATKKVTDTFIELDMKGYNRADLLSMRGVAYEIAAITDSKVYFEETDETKFTWVKDSYPNVTVTVENTDLSPIYTITKIEGLRVGPSPREWIKRLEESGMRSVNNIADVTNLIMLEYGQPLHAFDAKNVKDETIIVRNAKKGEELVTLDNKNRKLDSSDLLIADPQKALGLAGVMGGKDSEVSEETTTILLEAAIFDPSTLRKTVTRHALPSEASKRFVHGLTPKRLFQALNAAILMYTELGGKLTALTIKGENEHSLHKIPLSLEKTNSLIGVTLTSNQIEEYLKKLYFEIEIKGEGKWIVTPPYFRLDVEIEEDVIEEIARMYGYPNIPATPLKGEMPEKVDQSLVDYIYKTKTTLADIGATEVQTYPFYSTKAMDSLGLGDSQKENLVKISNPISAETEYMRDHIWPNLVEVIDKNIRQGFKNITIFEIGKRYSKDQDGKISEEFALSIAVYDNSDDPIQKLYSVFSKLSDKLNLNLSSNSEKKTTENIFHPNRFLVLNDKNGKVVGSIAEVHKRVTDKLGIEKRAAILEIGLNN